MLTLNDGRSELWQWDTGRKLTADADCSQVHFSNKVFGRSIDVDVVDGVAVIPDILLQADKDLNVWAFVGTPENGYTKISKVFKVNKRNKPADYVFTPPEQTTLEEIKEKLDYLESIQDPDAIKNAVDEYLANNPIQIDEKDPTVPDWAKQTTKPKYTATEVGAVAKVNGVKPDANGNVEITIPDSGGNDDYVESVITVVPVGADGDVVCETLAYIDTSGNLAYASTWCCSDFIAVNSKTDAINVNLRGYSTVASVAFYDNVKSFISCVSSDAAGGYVTGAVEVPENAEFVRFSFSVGHDQMATVTKTTVIGGVGYEELVEKVETIEACVEDLGKKVAVLEEMVGEEDKITTNTKFVPDGTDGDVVCDKNALLYAEDGTEAATGGWRVSGFIAVNSKTDSIVVNLCGRTNVASVSFYDENKTFVSCVSASVNDGWVSGSVPMPINAEYVRFCFKGSVENQYADVKTVIVNDGEDDSQKEYEALLQRVSKLESGSTTYDYDAILSNTGVHGYLMTNGVPTLTDNWVSSNYIRVNPACTIDYYLRGSNAMALVAFYDENQKFISGIVPAELGFFGDSGVTVPDNAYYIKHTASKAGDDYLNQFITINYNKIEALYAELYRGINSNPLYKKALTATGDSITAAYYNNDPHGSYAQMISAKNNMTFENKAIWGATVADDVEGSSGCILNTLSTMQEDADYIIISGGVNDFYYLGSGVETLGEITTGYNATFDTTTFYGALEAICKTAIERWPGKKILYVITHRILDVSVDKYANLEDYVAGMIQILQKWGISYVDLFHDVPPLGLPALKDSYTRLVNGVGDGLHPNEAGCRKYYVPRVEAKLKAI